MQFEKLVNQILTEGNPWSTSKHSRRVTDRESDDPALREEDKMEQQRSKFSKKEGDVFTDKNGKTWKRYKKADGTLGVKPHKA